MSEMKLSLNPQQNGAPRPEKQPVMGWFAVAFGFLGIFTIGVVFVPLGFVCSILAILFGQAVWGFVGMLLAAMGLITSPNLLLLIGMAAFAHWFDWNEFIQPLFDVIGVDPSPGKDI